MEQLHAVCVDGPLAGRELMADPMLPDNLSAEPIVRLEGHCYTKVPQSRYPLLETVHEYVYLWPAS